MPPAYVKPYVKRQKNDVVDAVAICEAVTRANMRFVATKTPEQRSCLVTTSSSCSTPLRPTGATMPNSARWARIALITAVC